jgi:glycosyltransferase involved in cell wall biosynthesis
MGNLKGMKESPDPVVSVCIQTYQHVAFIGKCLDSILMQETRFPFEIILGEDESTDGTRDICIAYANKYPGKIRLFLRSRKDVIYINGKPSGRFNFIENLKAAKGDYIAICEGDDYWTDKHKLQKQVDAMSNGYGVVYHNTVTSANETVPTRPLIDFEFGFKDSLCTKNGNTLSMMIRKSYLADWKLQLLRSDKIFVGDWPLECLMTIHGKGYFLKEPMGYYRLHAGGLSKNFNKRNFYIGRLNFLNVLLQYQTNIGVVNYQIIVEAYCRIYFNYLFYCIGKVAIKELFKSFKYVKMKYLLKLRYTNGWKKAFRYDYIFTKIFKTPFLSKRHIQEYT